MKCLCIILFSKFVKQACFSPRAVCLTRLVPQVWNEQFPVLVWIFAKSNVNIDHVWWAACCICWPGVVWMLWCDAVNLRLVWCEQLPSIIWRLQLPEQSGKLSDGPANLFTLLSTEKKTKKMHSCNLQSYRWRYSLHVLCLLNTSEL